MGVGSLIIVQVKSLQKQLLYPQVRRAFRQSGHCGPKEMLDDEVGSLVDPAQARGAEPRPARRPPAMAAAPPHARSAVVTSDRQV